MTRTLYAFAELTKQDPSYTGPEFNSDQILRDLITQVSRIRPTPVLSLTHYHSGKQDPSYSGPAFSSQQILRDLITQVNLYKETIEKNTSLEIQLF